MGRVLGYSLAILCLLAAGCGSRAGKEASVTTAVHAFPPAPKVPSVISDPQEAQEYFVVHYWDAFLSESHPCDSAVVNGVKADDVESALGMYITLLERNIPLAEGKKAMTGFFDRLEKFQQTNTSSNVFGFFLEMVPKYLYDPNSPVRDEDLYLPFVSRLAVSDLVAEDMKPAYSYEARMCSLNQVGSPAADFTFTDILGRRHSLYGIKAGTTLLFFTNPGCPACRDIIQSLTGSPRISALVKEGKLAVVNVYIDQELDKWREYASGYPDSWYNGYDQSYSIRQDVSYNVRAIPSMYILDKDKRVVMKDAPTEKVIQYLERL